MPRRRRRPLTLSTKRSARSRRDPIAKKVFENNRVFIGFEKQCVLSQLQKAAVDELFTSCSALAALSVPADWASSKGIRKVKDMRRSRAERWCFASKSSRRCSLRRASTRTGSLLSRCEHPCIHENQGVKVRLANERTIRTLFG